MNWHHAKEHNSSNHVITQPSCFTLRLTGQMSNDVTIIMPVMFAMPSSACAVTGINLKAVCQVLLTIAAKAIDSQALLSKQNEESRSHLSHIESLQEVTEVCVS